MNLEKMAENTEMLAIQNEMRMLACVRILCLRQLHEVILEEM